jgi:dethiobiotin synthetase
MSPHASAALDGVHIEPDEIREPVTSNDLVIEGAGGLLVPLNEQNTLLDLIRKDYRTILVSRNYLGSINHTLLSLEALRSRGLGVSGIIFNGERVPSTEQIIEKIGKVPVLGRIELEKTMDRRTVSKYAELLRNPLRQL